MAMRERPSENEVGKRPTTPIAPGEPDEKPRSLLVEFSRFLRSWPFLGASGLILLGWYWGRVQDFPVAPYLVASGLSVWAAIVLHKVLGRKRGVVLSVIVGVVIFLCTRQLTQQSNINNKIETKPPSPVSEAEVQRWKTETEIASKEGWLGPQDDCPGVSVCVVSRINGLVLGRPNYIFDFGESQETNRISLFLKPDQALWFRVVDQESNSFSTRPSTSVI